MISEKNPKIGAVGNSARLGPGGHVLATSPMQKSGFHPEQFQRKSIRKVLLPPRSPPRRVMYAV